MRYFNLSFLLLLFCFQVHGVTLKPEFQLGEKQQPQLDKLLPDVATRLTFNKESTKLIAHQMDGNIVEWDMQTYQKRLICTVEEDQWASYSQRINCLLTQKADGGITIIDVANKDKVRIEKRLDLRSVENIEDKINGRFENGCFSQDGLLIALTEGRNQFELWSFNLQSYSTKPINPQAMPIYTKALQYLAKHTFKTQLPIRNGITISLSNRMIAAAEGTYRDGEGHRTIIEVWIDYQENPFRVFDTGEILGVWNLVFSNYGKLIAVDTQLNAKSGIRVWDIFNNKQILNKSGFEAYWTRALAFAPKEQPNDIDYLASGDEKGYLRIWNIPGGETLIWETYPTGIQALAFSPNGEYLAVALWDTTIQILRWNRNE